MRFFFYSAFFTLLAFIIAGSASATHNRAGEVTYRHLTGLTYEITVTTYTKESSYQADRCEVEIKVERYNGGNWNFIDTIPRVNEGPCFDGSCDFCGESMGNDVKKNVYRTNYTFPGADYYLISLNDPNRNGGIMNIPNSENTTFYVESMLLIDNFGGHNTSPVLLNPPIDNGCVNQLYQHNPQATDTVDANDELRYYLVSCSAADGNPLSGYQFPNEVPGNPGVLEIDSLTGTVMWNTPKLQGEFNLCIKIVERRNGIIVGFVIRDMQITIFDCNNKPPVIEPLPPLCLLAGDTLDLPVVASDPDGDYVTITGKGYALDLPDSLLPRATFDSATALADVTSNLYWETSCLHVRKYPYKFFFKATDNNSVFSLADFETFELTIVAPAPENPEAEPQGNNMNLSWNPSICQEATCYKIYRKLDSLGFTPAECELGVPSYTGYELIGETSGWSSTTFTDTGGEGGLIPGQEYCYMVVACFEDGAESYASVEFCSELKRDIPVITRVSVNSTDLVNGSDTITWSMPTELDLAQYPGPYEYKVFRDDNFITSVSSAVLNTADTIIVDSPLNTEIQHIYKIEFYSGADKIGVTQSATSVYLTTSPSDNKVSLSWTETVPWTNSKYMVFRKLPSSSVYEILDTVYVNNYLDSNLLNGREYCYFVRSIGSYSSSGFINPILNNSQESCAEPIDTEAPCSPLAPEIQIDCDLDQNYIEWVNPNGQCADDVVGYNIYFAPYIGLELQLLDTIRDASVTYYDRIFERGSIAGCYGITAIDTFFNESNFSEILCVDNCPVYELPNVFTPGSDNRNDLFGPYPYKFIESIDLKIYNRWGTVVFETTDPDILWDGTDINSKKPCSTGVYYYLCYVNEIRLSGTETRTLKGYIHMFRELDSTPSN